MDDVYQEEDNGKIPWLLCLIGVQQCCLFTVAVESCSYIDSSQG